MCLRRAPEKYITGAALDRAGLGSSCVKVFAREACEATELSRWEIKLVQSDGAAGRADSFIGLSNNIVPVY
jgi:hypothetical protein